MPLQKGIIPLSELPLRNDFMFGEVMRTEDICQLFLEELLGLDIRHIEFIDKQKELSDSYTHHGIRLDVYLKDDVGTVFNVEMQSTNHGDLSKRARFYQSAIDRDELPKGADYENLSESYIIFVCDFDYFQISKAVCERVSFLIGTNAEYKDGSHVFFLNSHYTESNASQSILELLDMIRTNDLEKPYKTPLGQKAKARIQAVRSDKALEVSYMTIAQKMLDERKIGHAEAMEDAVLAMKDLTTPDDIAQRLKLSLEQVLKILSHEN